MMNQNNGISDKVIIGFTGDFLWIKECKRILYFDLRNP